MWFWATNTTRSRAVSDGRRERAFCCDCQRDTTFAEVEVVDRVALFSVLTLDEENERAFRCTECGALGQLMDTGEVPVAELDAASRRALLAQRKARLERERSDRSARADLELAALKQRMGLASAAPEPTQQDPTAAPQPSWWRRLRRSR